MFIISITNMINMVKIFNSKKILVLVRYRLSKIIDTQVARRGRQYHSQPSYKRQKLVPTPHPTRPSYKRQKLVPTPPHHPAHHLQKAKSSTKANRLQKA